MALLTINPAFLIHMPAGDQWIWLLLVFVLLFGGKKIPELAKGIGKGVRDFNDAKKGIQSEIEAGLKDKEETTKA